MLFPCDHQRRLPLTRFDESRDVDREEGVRWDPAQDFIRLDDCLIVSHDWICLIVPIVSSICFVPLFKDRSLRCLADR